tara:strand:- start:2 stop:196 length:195 start_codon:yes stop_codon:yes gene_type:complete
MKELVEYNKSLLEIAERKLKWFVEADYNKNHPGPYFEAINKQVDYVNTIKERIKTLNEKTNNNK